MAEAGDLKLFLQKILDGGTEQLRINVDAQTSKQELEKLQFNDWVSILWITDYASFALAGAQL